MNKLSERLKELRIAAGLTQQELSIVFFVNQRTVSNWENGKREPDLVTFVKIAKFFEVSADYLLGLED